MKIRDLNLDDYVIVYDVGKSENSEGMTVVGRVDEIIFNEDDENEAGIDSLGNLYHFDDNNYFDLWSNSIKDKTESINKVRIKDLNAGDTIQIPNGKIPLEGKVKTVSEDSALVEIPMVGHRFISDEIDFKRIRKASKPLDPTKWLEKAVKENSEKTKLVLESGLGISKPTYQYKQSNDLQQRKRKEGNTKPDYYQFDDFEMYEIVEAICKHYNPVVATWIGQAIQYIGRAPRKNGKEDIGKARDMIERAFEVWDVK